MHQVTVSDVPVSCLPLVNPLRSKRVRAAVVSWPLHGARHDGGMRRRSCLLSSTSPPPRTTNPGSAPLLLSWLFINRPGRPRLALYTKIRSYQYSTAEEEVRRGCDLRFLFWKVWWTDWSVFQMQIWTGKIDPKQIDIFKLMDYSTNINRQIKHERFMIVSAVQ